MVTDRLKEIVIAAVEAARGEGLLPPGSAAVEFERPRRKEHGDWSTNIALALGAAGASPRRVADLLVQRMQPSPLVAGVEVAGPGFINFRLSDAWLHDVVARAAGHPESFGRLQNPAPKRINVEYVSANPTGPVNVVSGRHAAVGDAIANLLAAAGHEVTREYYVNDAGRQTQLFAASLSVHYLREFGVEADLPEDGYKGDYVADIARDIASELGDRLVEAGEAERVAVLREKGVAAMVDVTRESLARFGTQFDTWFSEKSLHDAGKVRDALAELQRRGLAEEREGALWFVSTTFGDDKDRVLVRAGGEPTYLAADAAYLVDKFERGFDHALYVWGSDHHGTVARLRAVADALDLGSERVEVRLIQTVTLVREGEVVKASKRAGVVVPLDDLVDEVGKDAARYTFLTRSLDAPLEFDIGLAKKEAPENPVFYVQYAHARICSILRNAPGKLLEEAQAAVLDPLTHASEHELMRKLAAFEEVVPDAADTRAPQKLCRYVEELAAQFAAFYRDCRVLSDDSALSAARLRLCLATKNVIGSALNLLGVSAPERM